MTIMKMIIKNVPSHDKYNGSFNRNLRAEEKYWKHVHWPTAMLKLDSLLKSRNAY